METRRIFLTAAPLGMGTVAIGGAIYTIDESRVPNADYLARKKPMQFDLKPLMAGSIQRVVHDNRI
ncbi:MAG: hypothetical protein ACR2PF_09420 [Rhizobiaceae bacterium]